MKIKRDLAWMTLSQGLFLVLNFASSVIVARLLSPYEMGIFVVAMAVVGVLGALQAFGLHGLIIREAELTPAIVRSAFTINALISLSLSAVVVLLSQIGGSFLHEDGVRRVMLVLGVLPLVAIFDFLPSSQLERNANFRSIAVVSLARGLISAGVTVFLAVNGQSYMSMAYGQIAGAVIGAIAFNIIGRRHVSLRLGSHAWRPVLAFGLNNLSIFGVHAITARLSEAMLGRIVGLTALGLYGRASSLNNLIWDNGHVVIGRVVFVDIAAQKRAGKSLRQSYFTIIDVLTALLWPAFAGLALCSGPFIHAVYGGRWVAASHPLALLAIAAMLHVAISLTWDLFIVSGETATQAKIEYFRAFAALVMFVVGCRFGLTGAAASRVGDALFSIWLYRPYIDRMTDTRLKDFVPIYLRSTTVTALAIAPAALVMWRFGFSELTPLGPLIVSIEVGVIFWVAALVLSKHPLGVEIVRLWRRFDPPAPETRVS
jgi:O-antigen/teichoic acid export membrane protein